MNDTTEDNPIGQIMEIIIEQGFGGMDQAMTILIKHRRGLHQAWHDHLGRMPRASREQDKDVSATN